MQPDKMTDAETADVGKLLSEVQDLIEKGEYDPRVVINVLLNVAARYAAFVKWPERNFKKVCMAMYRTQKRAFEVAEEKKAEKEAQAAAPPS